MHQNDQPTPEDEEARQPIGTKTWPIHLMLSRKTQSRSKQLTSLVENRVPPHALSACIDDVKYFTTKIDIRFEQDHINRSHEGYNTTNG